jgi:glycosyltransferase involved in cell wall biosynthesis
MRIGAIVPAHNESDRIGATVSALRALPLIDVVLVVDDGSTDETATAARHAGATVIRRTANEGKGAALQAGATALDADVYLFADADLGVTATQATLLLAPLLAGDADMSIATFPAPQRKGGFGFVRTAAAEAVTAYGRCALDGVRTPSPVFVPQAPLSGQRALTRACLEAVCPLADRYGVEVALSIDALRAGMRLVEVPTTMSHRETGRDLPGILHRVRQYLDVRKALRRYR